MRVTAAIQRVAVAGLLGLPAIGAPGLAQEAPEQPRGKKPRVTKEIRPWRPSLDQPRGDAQGGPLRPDHYLWSPGLMEAKKLAAFVDPDLPVGREVSDDEPETEADPLPLPKAPKTKQDFAGLDRGNAGHLGDPGFPPDTMVAASPSKVLEVVNVAARLTDRNGGGEVIQSLNNLFAVTDPTLFDPKVYFDRLSGRFFLVALSVEFGAKKSHFYVAVSRDDDPQGLTAPDDFCTYKVNAKRGSWADYPSIGINENWFAVSVNNFKFNNFEFKAAYVYVMPVDELTDNAAECPAIDVSRFKVKKDAEGVTAFTLQPAQHYSTNNLEGTPLFLLSTQPLFSSSTYNVMRIESDEGGDPLLKKDSFAGSFDYGLPPLAPQEDGLLLDSGDMRMMQAAYRDGELWGVHATACSVGALPNESCIRAVRFEPTDAGVTLTFEETYGKNNWFYFWPGIAVNKKGHVVVAFQRSKDNKFLGVAYNGKKSGKSSFDAVKRLKNGNCSLFNFDPFLGVNRTGDYVGVQTDPDDDVSFWIGGEHAGDVNPALGCDWKTRIGRVKY